jgi:hypothetical protein
MEALRTRRCTGSLDLAKFKIQKTGNNWRSIVSKIEQYQCYSYSKVSMIACAEYIR